MLVYMVMKLLKYKKQLKIEGNRERIRKIERKIKVLKLAIISWALILCTMLYMIFSLIVSINNTMNSIMGTVVMEVFENDDANREKFEGVDTNVSDEEVEEVDSGIDTGGGLYPKDQKLRLRAELIEILKKSSEDASKALGFKVEPAWMLGTMFRESGTRFYSAIDNLKINSLYTDLVITNPACGKGDSCSFMRSGVSHYVGGSVTVVNGSYKDTGNPASHRFLICKEEQAPYDGDHAIGYFQFEIPYLYCEMNRKFGNPTPVIPEKYSQDNNALASYVTLDSNLGFIRPNPFYIPDAAYSATFVMAGHMKSPISKRDNPSRFHEIVNSAEFKALDEYDQRFIRFMYASAAYGRGKINGNDDEYALKLIQLKKTVYANKHLDEMLYVLGIDKVYWNSSNNMPSGRYDIFLEKANEAYSLGSSKFNASWYGIYSAVVGKVIYDRLTEVISKAEKEGTRGGGSNSGSIKIVGSSNGNWVGRPGSGRFGNKSGSKYYLDSIGIKWYYQTSKVTKHSSTWGSLPLLPNSTMARGGCGIYTLAMIASNLYDKDITPDIALRALEGKYQARCLVDAGVPYLANKLGLQTTIINYTRPDIKDVIINELNKGNMILCVVKANRGEFEWYSGAGHFIAIRGYTDDKKLLCITSCGANGRSPEQVMQIPMDMDKFLRYLSRNRNYFWSVGIKK
ncbi:MAG: hypothetical protein QXD03_05495 [Candidatus Anstonellales archaeon]